VRQTPKASAGGAAERPDFVDRFVRPFVQESTLWPVLVVVIGHAAVGIALLLLQGVRDGSLAAWAALALLAWLSLHAPVYEARRQRRPGPLSAIVLAGWALGAVLAALADRAGFY